MNKLNSQSYNKLKQKLKKYLAEGGDQENLFADQLLKYRENPIVEEGAKKEKKESSESDSDAEDSSSDDSSSDGSGSSSNDEKPAKKKDEAVKKEAKEDDGSSSEESSSESSSSGSSSGSDSDSSDDDKKSGDDSDEEEEQEVVKKGELPKKYAFLGLPHEEKTPQQRRWKWVKFEFLPEDMKPFIRPPKATAAKEKDTKKRPAAAVQKEDEEQTVVDIIDDRDLDYTKQENVDTILNKYKNQQISRRNFDPEFQITVLHLMLKAQEANKTVKIEILMLLVATYFAQAKNAPNGFFER
jgi:hypothetical protein